MLPYTSETFTDDERDVLRRYVTNLDGPVFALVNLPEVVKGALFARYSRSPKSLRRLFLDEFVGELDTSGDLTVDATTGLARAEQLYERVFGDYGDDSVAQLGGVHLACEQASNVLTKVLEWGRLMSYLEQSTRYIPYDVRLVSGHYRYYRDPEVLESPLGARYVGDMDRMFDTYASLLPRLQAHIARRFPRDDSVVSEIAYRQSVRAKALDALRGLLPAGALSNLGIYASGQAYEHLLLRMGGHPLPEVRRYAGLIHDELAKVIPSFLTRLDRADRGGVWRDYLAATRDDTAAFVAALWPEDASSHGAAGLGEASVRLTDHDPDGEDKVLQAICFPVAPVSGDTLARRVAALGPDQRRALLEAYVGRRANRRHKPGRAFEATSYRFEIVSDYGAFRDLQRHRMLTVEWQPLTTTLGWTVPEVVVEAGLEPAYVASLERSHALHEDLRPSFPEQAAYAIALAFQLRYSLQLNAREAMHLCELRSSPQGHPSYRRIAQAMHRQIAEVAGHRALAAAMGFVDHGEVELGRLEAEERRAGRAGERASPDPGPANPLGGPPRPGSAHPARGVEAER